MRETDIAARVIAYLQDLRYEVHQEVSGADIVALMGSRAWIIECKTQLGLDVLAQAWNWVRRAAAAYVSVATPIFRRDDARVVAEHFLREQGIGWLTVGDWHTQTEWRHEYPISEQIQPRVQTAFRREHRHAYRQFDIRKACNDKTLNGYAEAGSPAPRQWTPFKQVCENVREAIAKHGPMTTRELVDTIEHHYASAAGARSRLAHYLGRGIVPGVEYVPDSRPTRWQLATRKAVA